MSIRFEKLKEYRIKDEPKTQMKTQNSNLIFEKRTMRDCFLCKWLGDVDVCGRCRNRNLFAEADTEPKPKDEPQTCEDCKHNGEKHAYDYACDKCTDMDKFQHEDEPQTERSE